ncbi:MAG: DNA/RNA nuclease SfsA [Hyphomonadaceae bacterium]|nr:DNA/RNA nuclease SfsA [Hyphomonadaceae bacterium]
MQLPPLIPGRLVRRYKRFLADIELDETGETIIAHCPNPGSMLGLKAPGSRVWLSVSDNPKRKLKHTLELIEADGTLIGINTNLPNKLAEEAIRAGTIPELTGFENLRREVKYAARSRVDLLLETGGQKTFVEVKNCHLMRQPGLAEFPDSVTSRGAKHLEDLAGEVATGHRAVMLFIVQRADCTAFATAADLDPAYHAGLQAAADAGVEVLVYDCHISEEDIKVRKAIPWVPAPH